MGRVLLLQLDGTQPNLALMRVSAHHRALGDAVEFRAAHHPRQVARVVERDLWDAPYDKVYASLLFERTRPAAGRLLQVYPGAVVGGTGWSLTTTLADHGIDGGLRPDYSIYPGYPHSIGFTQRGCRLCCPFCVVPEKEGPVRPVGSVADVWRGAGHPKNILLMDNDFFGQPNWRALIDEMVAGDYRVSFNQGVNCRMLTAEVAAAIARVRYYDDGFKRPRLYTAWDNLRDEGRLFAGLDLLKAAGVLPGRIVVYVLVGYWPGETWESRVYRVERLLKWGARPYPMPYARSTEMIGFQRWAIRAVAKKLPWEAYRAMNCDSRRRKKGGETPLFDQID